MRQSKARILLWVSEDSKDQSFWRMNLDPDWRRKNKWGNDVVRTVAAACQTSEYDILIKKVMKLTSEQEANI